ncbi:MAG: nickel ABC transporter, nickel/metallophore periplasmic binding protein [Alphaproteobacteria bacterium]|nr:nickel ABC transporter, nickel/metallophore periplasmic binding protein [Alphaproteobacteria bacterium]
MPNWTKGWRAAAMAGLLALAALAGPAAAKDFTMPWRGDVGPLNPHLYEPNEFFAQDMVYDGLVSYGPGGRILPALAERWEVAPDGARITFHLRRGVVFSDGTPFDAQAVKLNFEQVLANKSEHDWLALVALLTNVEALDSHTVRLTLASPYYPALQELTLIRPLRFLSPKAIPKEGTAKGVKAPIGTGPWVLAEYRENDRAVFVRNERYWGVKPSLERVVVRIMPDAAERSLAFQRGQLDMIYHDKHISLQEFKRLQANPRFAAHVSEPLITRMVVMNAGRGPTKDPTVRRAIQHAFNRDAVIQFLFHGIEKRADALFSPAIPYCDLGLEGPAFDPDMARALLDEAGWVVVPGKTVRERQGERLSLEVSYEKEIAIDQAMAQALQADLRAIGIEVTLLGEPMEKNRDRSNAGLFHLSFSTSWGPPYDPHTYLSGLRLGTEGHPDHQALIGLPIWKDLDAQIVAIMAEIDEPRRRERYRTLLTTIHDQAVYLPIAHGTNLAVTQQSVTGFGFEPQSNSIPINKLGLR